MIRSVVLAANPDAPLLTRWAWIPVAGPVDLSQYRAEAPGPTRRTGVFEAMQQATRTGAEAVLARIRTNLDEHGASSARLGVQELLWADGSAVLRIDVPRGDDAAIEVVDGVLNRAGARSIDGRDLPRAGLSAPVGAPLPSTRRRAMEVPADAETTQWYAQDLGFDAARAAGLVGDGVRVAVVDSGVDPNHPDLRAALTRGGMIDAFAGVPVTSGHGTFVAGVLAGARTGLAPGVQLISSRTYGARFGDYRGLPDEARRAQRVNAIHALQEAVDPPAGSQLEAGADVVVASWGILDAPGVPSSDYDQTMATLAAAGVVCVVAAGNDGGRSDGGGTISEPAQSDDVLAVGGVDRGLRWHPKASTGPAPDGHVVKPDLSAPVVDARSTALGGGLVDTSGQPDAGFAGTSAAAPAAAAAVALLTEAIHRRGGASPDIDEVRGVLSMLTRDADAPGPDPRTGMGVIDVHRVDEAAAAIVAARGVASDRSA